MNTLELSLRCGDVISSCCNFVCWFIFYFFFFIRGKLKKLDLKEITFRRWRSGGFLERVINGETFARLLVSPRLISRGSRAAGSQSATGTRTGV